MFFIAQSKSCEIKMLLFVDQERRKQLAARKKRNSDKAKRKPASENFLHQVSSNEKASVYIETGRMLPYCTCDLRIKKQRGMILGVYGTKTRETCHILRSQNVAKFQMYGRRF